MGLPRFERFADWPIEHVHTGHRPMISAPDELATALDRLAWD